MYNLGKSKLGQRVFLTNEQLIDAAQDPLKYKKDCNAQQWAKLRKLIKKHLKSQV